MLYLIKYNVLKKLFKDFVRINMGSRAFVVSIHGDLNRYHKPYLTCTSMHLLYYSIIALLYRGLLCTVRLSTGCF